MLAEKTSLSSQYFYDLQKSIVIERGLALLPVTSPTEAGKILAQMVNPLLLKTFWRFCECVQLAAKSAELLRKLYSKEKIGCSKDQCFPNRTTLQRWLFYLFEEFPCIGSLGFLWYQNSSFSSLLCLVLWKCCFSLVILCQPLFLCSLKTSL